MDEFYSDNFFEGNAPIGWSERDWFDYLKKSEREISKFASVYSVNRLRGKSLEEIATIAGWPIPKFDDEYFEESDAEFSDAVWYAGKTLRVSVRVRNESERAGREIVQLYIRDRKASVCRPVRELKDFAAVDLRPHEEREVVFELDEKSIGFYGTGFCFLVEEGWFDIFVGKDSRTKNGKSIYYSAGSPGQRKIGTN